MKQSLKFEFLVACATVHNALDESFMDFSKKVDEFFEFMHSDDDVYQHFSEEYFMHDYLTAYKEGKWDNLSILTI